MNAAAVYSIAAGEPFLDALVAGIYEDPRLSPGSDPAALAAMRIFLPTRRACRALADAFIRANAGRPLLLPRMTPLGDIDEDDLVAEDTGDGGPDAFAGDMAAAAAVPSAISPLRRQLLLARLVMAAKPGISTDQAARLAAELARLLDQVHTEDLDFAALADLVPEDFASHWQITLDFLAIITARWPEILAEEDGIDPARRRSLLLRAQAQAWRDRPLENPVIAAGSTGSIPATADLLRVIAGMPRGAVILPGLDRDADDAAWSALEPSHPQYGMARLLSRLGVERAAVKPWPPSAGRAQPSPRAALISLALRPAAAAHLEVSPRAIERHLELGLDNVIRIVAPTPHEEARTIALILRETLVHPGRQGILITPDRALARRVAGELERWEIAVDDSAGVPLGKTQPGAFLRLSARMLTAALAPVPLLATLKHPLAAGGMRPAAFRDHVRRLEREILRGPRPAPGLAGLEAALAGVGDDAAPARLVARLRRIVTPFTDVAGLGETPLVDLLAAHLAVAEALCAGEDETGAERLWADEAGEIAYAFASELFAAAADFPAVRPAVYPALLDEMMAGRTVRPRYGRHPRLAILGPLEARLLSADVVVLAGLNEGTWPAKAQASPWMSRPMMETFGLPSPERRIGLAAHDFAQAFCAQKVYLTRSARVEGTPSVASRWLLRLENLVADTTMKYWLADNSFHLALQAQLDWPDVVASLGPPRPCPPVEARPRALSVTQVETWMRDPYAIYARHILRLRALEPLDADPSAGEYGEFVHRALEAFTKATPGALPGDAYERLLAIGRKTLSGGDVRPSVLAFWWPRFERIARWFVDHEREHRAGIAAMASEVKGSLVLDGPEGAFTVKAVADRIDTRRGDGDLVIIDYKTGAVPTQKEVAAGYAPQLPLEAAIARTGGFAGVAAAPIAAIEYWQLSGGTPGGKCCPAVKKTDPESLADEAVDGVRRLIARFDLAETPYEARPHASFAPKFSDYEHLARVKEWSTEDGSGEE